MTTFEKLLEALSEQGIEYILIGGLAVDLCGFSRATMGVDVLIEASEENIRRLLNCLRTFGQGSANELKVEDFSMEEGCVRIVEDFPLDVFTLIKGQAYRDLLVHSEIFTTEKSIKIRYLNAEGLIRLKKDSLRTKDQLDVRELKRIKKKS